MDRDNELLRRFAETRRKHPLSRASEGLRQAIALERELLDPVVQAADLIIDTSQTGVHELRDLIRNRVERRRHPRLSILFQSFGFKYGIPGDADFVFDARSLPNPYWEPGLRWVSVGNVRIKRVAELLLREVPELTTFCSLSRIPGLLAWLQGAAPARLGEPASLAFAQLG